MFSSASRPQTLPGGCPISRLEMSQPWHWKWSEAMCIIIGFASEAFLLLGESDRRLHMLDAVRANGYVLRFAHPACYDYANIASTAVTASVGAVVFLSSGTDPMLLSRIQDEIAVPWLRKLCSTWTKGNPGDQHDLEAGVRVWVWLRLRAKSLKGKDFDVLDKLCNKVCSKVVPHLPNGAVVKKVLRMQGSSFRFAASSVKDDADACLIALGSPISNFRWASCRLKKDQSFLLRALKVDRFVYRQIDPLRFFKKRATVICVAEAVGCEILHDLPDFLLTDNEVIKAALSSHRSCYCRDLEKVELSSILASQRDIVLEAALSAHPVGDNFWKAVDPSVLEDHVLWSAFLAKGVFNLVGTEQQRITSSHKISDDYVVEAMKSAKLDTRHRGRIIRAIELKKRPRLVKEMHDLMMGEPVFASALIVYKFMKRGDCNAKIMLGIANCLGEIEKLNEKLILMSLMSPMPPECKKMSIIERATCAYGYNDIAAFRKVLSLDWE